jgi:hypothetical protein
MERLKFVALLLMIGLNWTAFSQQNLSLLNQFYRDRYFLHAGQADVPVTSVFPFNESDFDLNKRLADSSKQYYELTQILFKKHLLEFKGEDYYLTISPVADLSIGKDLSDTNSRRLFQNTRGIFVEGDLLKNFSFSTAFYENQSRLSTYETSYYRSIGELYPNQSSGVYNTQNAVIPGAARTKPFKSDGFDYAYAQGNLIYKPHRSIALIAGNTPHFIGNGYRSILLSDNGVGSPFFRADVTFSKKWKFMYLRQRLLNLMRKPVSTTVESYYESKGMSVNYLTFHATKKIAISLFESAIWSRGDSLSSFASNPLIYNPIPFVAPLAIGKDKLTSVIGLNLSMLVGNNHHLYGQFALTNLNVEASAFQLGYRGYSFFGLKDFMLQLEYNYVAKDMYSSSNRRLNYMHYNLPIAHPAGTNFNEFLLRTNYEWKRIYADLKTIVYLLEDHSSVALLPVKKITTQRSGSVLHNQLEVGYRFNRKMNLTIFGSWLLRSEMLDVFQKTSIFSFGLRTAINNHYNDF